jgi:hypothetical protein
MILQRTRVFVCFGHGMEYMTSLRGIRIRNAKDIAQTARRVHQEMGILINIACLNVRLEFPIVYSARSRHLGTAYIVS